MKSQSQKHHEDLSTICSAAMGGKFRAEDLTTLNLVTANQLKKGLEAGLIKVSLKGVVERTLKPLTADLWQPEEKPIPDLSIKRVPPSFPGCSVKNADSAEKFGYWFLSGFESEIRLVAGHLNKLGITATPVKNGSNGKYFLIIDLWVTGTITEWMEDHYESGITDDRKEQV